jgi:hypothetical protein
MENSEIIKSTLELLDDPTERKLVQFLTIRTSNMSFAKTIETVNLVIKNLKDMSLFISKGNAKKEAMYKSFYEAMSADRILEKVASMRHLQ